MTAHLLIIYPVPKDTKAFDEGLKHLKKVGDAFAMLGADRQRVAEAEAISV